jgi:hypothetical protein
MQEPRVAKQQAAPEMRRTDDVHADSLAWQCCRCGVAATGAFLG